MHQPVVLHHPHRTWLNIKGQVVAGTAPTTHDEPVTLKWTAKVLNADTDQPVDTYPELSGEVTVHTHSNRDIAIEDAYCQKLRFVDGSKPDVELLKTNLNLGLWLIDSDSESVTDQPPQTNH
jgi:hypothetical protein